MNSNNKFAKGIGLGLVVGSAIGVAVAPRKKSGKGSVVSKALKTMGDVIENISDVVGL